MKNKSVKKPVYTKWWFWIMIFIVGIGIGFGAGSIKDEYTKVAKTNSKVQPQNTGGNSKVKDENVEKSTETDKKVQEENTETNGTKTFKVGDTIKLKNFKVRVNKVYKVKGDEFSQPEAGNEFVAVDCSVENISNEQQMVSSITMFKVVDKDGRAFEESLIGLGAAKAGQMDGEIGPGRKLTGVYVVEVPKGTKGLELQLDSSFLLGGQVIVKLN
ncbi:DUF4352 domain-containing protein [Clostridium botulinum]|nr:DUF4352 domain-containing protein [Clostridium botulinum]